ncbi:MAG: DoxX family membrane protein [Verrucomicrobia bacterium]|nr:DoxX family membrane protein [Verrucomicrobiota bacterium]
MSATSSGETTAQTRGVDYAAALARWLVGALFIYMGLHKALHPVEFLKLVRQYDLPLHHVALNFVAATLPWFEIFCGLLLVCGIAVRGAALLLVAVLVPFTTAVLMRALAMQKAGGLPFCAIKFDCGCGAGEVLICRKLAENCLLIITATWLTFLRGGIFCLRPELLKKSPGDKLS